MAAPVSKTHAFLHHAGRGVSVPNGEWSTLLNDSVNGTIVRETNYPVEGFSYVETDRDGAVWFLRTALYEQGRLSPKGRSNYEWELAEREAASIEHRGDPAVLAGARAA